MKEIERLLESPLFWDINNTKLNPQFNKQFIICRVLDRGDIESVKIIINFYDKQSIKDSLINARFIEKKTIAFFANYFNIKPTDFKSWKSDSNIQWDL